MQPNFIVNDGHIYLRYRPELHAVLPHGAVLDIPQGKVIAIPHGIDEVKVLKNMGIEVSAPILHQYDWCGGKPFETQALTAAFITQNRRCFVTNQVGTGKTAAALYAFDYLKRRGEAKRLLVVAPLSTLNPTWRRECLLRTPHLSLQVLRGTKAQRLEVLAIPSDIYVINHDGVGVVIEELIKRLDIDMVVIDELTAFKNARADRSKNIQKVCASRKWVVRRPATTSWTCTVRLRRCWAVCSKCSSPRSGRRCAPVAGHTSGYLAPTRLRLSPA
jgi:hypothetical protein